jgi:hypothetical protein
VAKATYRLEAGEAQLSAEQDPIVYADTFWDDDPARSLRAPSDFAIAKRRADVVLIGSAFAPGGAPVHRLVANLGAGELEKTFEISADRWVDIRDELHEGAPFVSMPLVWERAANDGDGRNPPGRSPVRDGFGRLHLPNLGPVAHSPSPPDWSVPLVGVGPVAPSWPQRTMGLGEAGASLRATRFGAVWPEAWIEHGVPEDADFSFFQVAPADQQLERLPTDLHVVLENLSPKSAILGTRLPGHRVRGFAGPSATEVEFSCDTLVVDTDRQVATLTWRATIYASVFPRLERFVVLLERRDVRTPAEEIRRLCAPPEEATMGAELSHSDDGLPFAGRNHAARFANPPTMDSYVGTPFGRGVPAPPASSSGQAAPPQGMSPLQSFETTELPAIAATTLGASRIGLSMLGLSGQAAAQPPAAAPPPIASPAPVPPAVAPAAIASHAPVAPVAPPAQVTASPAPVAPPPMAARPPIAAASAVAPPAQITAPPVAAPAPARAFSTAALAQAVKAPSYMGDARETAPAEARAHDAKAALSGVAGASDAAADRPGNRSSRSADAPEPAKRAQGYFDLMWQSPSLAERLKTLPEWARLLRGGSKDWLTDKAREGRSADDGDRLVRRALARGTPLDGAGIHKAVLDAVDEDGVLVRPVVTVEGEVAVSFDTIEALNVSLSLSEHLAATDKKFKEAHDAASDLVRSNRKVTLPMIESGLTRLRQAFAASGKAYPAGYLESTAERWLSDERRYLKRTVLGAERLIASVTPAGSSTALPLYLPVELEQHLPTVPRFKARALVDPHAKQDAAEGEPTSLVALAIARVVGR